VNVGHAGCLRFHFGLQLKQKKLESMIGALTEGKHVLEKQLEDAILEEQKMQCSLAQAASEACGQERRLRDTIHDLTTTREHEKREVCHHPPTYSCHKRGGCTTGVERLVQAQLALDQQRAELEAFWERKMKRTVSDSLAAAELTHQESLRGRESDLEETLVQQHAAALKAQQERCGAVRTLWMRNFADGALCTGGLLQRGCSAEGKFAAV
jgi:hypothetical protein